MSGFGHSNVTLGEIHATGDWVGGYRTELRDDRDHRVTVDLPKDEDGADVGTSALELSVLALAGCISTIFLLVAERRRLRIRGVHVDLIAERPKGAPTVSRVRGTVAVDSDAAFEDVATALAITVRTCPVGVMFERAGIPVDVRAVRAEADRSSGGSLAPLPAAAGTT